MSEPTAELSSLSSALTDISARIGVIASDNATTRAPLANELFEIERNINRGLRRLQKLLAKKG